MMDSKNTISIYRPTGWSCFVPFLKRFKMKFHYSGETGSDIRILYIFLSLSISNQRWKLKPIMMHLNFMSPATSVFYSIASTQAHEIFHLYSEGCDTLGRSNIALKLHVCFSDLDIILPSAEVLKVGILDQKTAVFRG